MTLKEQLAADVSGVILNEDDFAESVTFGGRTFLAIKSETPTDKAEEGEGAYRRVLSLYCAESDVGTLPMRGTSLAVDGEAWKIEKIRKDYGMVSIDMAESSVNADALTESIEVYRMSASTGVNSLNEPSAPAEMLIATLWATVKVASTRENMIAAKDTEMRTHEARVQIPEGATEDPLLYDDRIVWRGTNLRVKGLRPDRHVGLLIADCVYVNG